MFQIVTEAPRKTTSSLAASAALHIALIVGLFTFGFPSASSKLPSRPLHFTLLAPTPDPPPRPRPKLPVLPPVRLAARVFVTPAPDPASLPAPPPPRRVILDLPPAPTAETPRVAAPATPDIPRVAPPVKTGTFAEALPPAPAPQPAPATTRTAGFTPAESVASKPARSLITAGDSFDAASSPQSGPRRAVPAHTGGFGETSAAPAPPGSRAAATPNGAFGDASTAAPTAARTAAPALVSPTTPVEILEKPHPAYTEEARRLSLEGEVLLEVSFAASGEARVLRLVRALGHGLDESASAAARSIRFRPARRDGVPIDSTAVVHIVFQLAY